MIVYWYILENSSQRGKSRCSSSSPSRSSSVSSSRVLRRDAIFGAIQSGAFAIFNIYLYFPRNDNGGGALDAANRRSFQDSWDFIDTEYVGFFVVVACGGDDAFAAGAFAAASNLRSSHDSGDFFINGIRFFVVVGLAPPFIFLDFLTFLDLLRFKRRVFLDFICIYIRYN